MSAPKPLKRACDQCHSVKEKCRRLSDNVSCERCDRLGHACRTSRNAAKAGRKSQVSRKVTYALPSSAEIKPAGYYAGASDPDSARSSLISYDAKLSSNSTISHDLDNWEIHFVNHIKSPIVAPSPFAKFLVGSCFYEPHHSSFVQNLIQPSPILRHATVACAAALLGDQYPEHAKAGLEVGHQRAALAVSFLRSLEIKNKADLETALILGVALLTFAMHVADGQPFLVSHYTLNLIKMQHPDLSGLDPSLMDLLMCLVSAETSECLLRSQVPTLRVDTHKRGRFVDRYLGISSSMLSYFYDICQVSNSLQNSAVADEPELLQQLHKIHFAVEHWQPEPPEDFIERFSQVEVMTMLAQARILQLTALLIIHRLKNPFGQHDQEAVLWSREITSEFERVLHLSNRSIPCTASAYLIACFEIMEKGAREKALDRSIHIVTFSKQAQIRFKATLISVWKARDSKNHLSWLELSKYLPEIYLK